MISTPGVMQFTRPKTVIEFGQTYKTFSVLKPFLVAFHHLFLIKSERGVIREGAFIEINTEGNKSVLIQPSNKIIISCISTLTCFNIIY